MVAVGEKLSFREIGYGCIGARSKVVGELCQAALIRVIATDVYLGGFRR
jgi:hypothetical protein